MKKTISVRVSAALVLAVGFFTATFPASGQSVLIEINQSDASAVQFIATVNGSLVNDSSQYNLFGVDLISYFTASMVSGSAAVTGNLIPAGTSAVYSQWHADNLTASGNVDLNLYNNSSPQLQIFTTSSPAFTGTATINLASLLADLPTTGSIGDIYSGDIRSPGKVIGQWVVVPEPPVKAQLALGATVFAGLALVRRSRRVAACR